MGILRRAGRIVTANVNDLFDQFEDPAKMVRQGLRDLELAIETGSAAVARSVTAERVLERHRDKQMRQVSRWHQRATQAIQAGDDVLARQAIARKLELTEAIQLLDERLGEARSVNERLQHQIDVLRERHAEARGKLCVLLARQGAAAALRKAYLSEAGFSSDSVWTDLERQFERAEWAEIEAEVHLDVEPFRRDPVLRQWERLEQDKKIEAELAAIKGRGDE